MKVNSGINAIKEIEEIIRELNRKEENLESNIQHGEEVLKGLSFPDIKMEYLTLTERKKVVEDHISTLQQHLQVIENYQNTNGVDIEKKLLSWTKEKEETRNKIKELDNVLSSMYKIFNVCPSCTSEGEIYDSRLSMGDPYGKSSDNYKTCRECDGSGTFY